jgi:hypothetical protein
MDPGEIVDLGAARFVARELHRVFVFIAFRASSAMDCEIMTCGSASTDCALAASRRCPPERATRIVEVLDPGRRRRIEPPRAAPPRQGRPRAGMTMGRA